MQVTIKNARVEAEVRELAKELNLGLTATIREAVQSKLRELDAKRVHGLTSEIDSGPKPTNTKSN